MPSYKDGVSSSGLKSNILNILKKVDEAHNDVAGSDAVITSTTDGTHMKGSLHYSGNAIDLRTNDITKVKAEEFTKKLKEKLGSGYDAVLEGDHIHLEYDPH
jgi:hypothetical protein